MSGKGKNEVRHLWYTRELMGHKRAQKEEVLSFMKKTSMVARSEWFIARSEWSVNFFLWVKINKPVGLLARLQESLSHYYYLAIEKFSINFTLYLSYLHESYP